MSAYPPPAESNSLQFNPENFLAAQSALTISIGDARYLRLNGGFVTGITTFDSGVTLNGNSTLTGELLMTGNAKDIHIDGIGSKINFSGLGSGIVMSSLSSSISMNSTLPNSISTSGGISVGAVLFGATQASYLTSITSGIASSSRALILDASRNITNINSLTTASLIISSAFNITSTTDSTSTSTGSFTTLGGVGIAKSLYVGTSISMSNASGGDMITLTTTSTGARNTIKFNTDSHTWELGARASAASNPNSFYIYNGAYKLVMDPTGNTSILSTTDSTGATTGCLKLSGGLGVAKNIYCTGWLDLNRNGSNLNITNPSSGVQALIELPASVNILRLVRGYAVNVGSNGVCIESASTRDPRCPLDFGQTTSNMIISLYNNTSSYYGLSVNNSATQYSSGSGHTWYSSCTNASPISFNSMSLTSSGTLTTAENVVAGTGFWAKQGFNSAGRSGIGVAVIMANTSYGEVYSYDYGTSQYKPIHIGNTMYVSDSDQSVNIGGGINAALYPLEVRGSSSTTFAPYGFLSSGGAGSGGSSGVVPVSIWAQHRIACTEFNAYSDRRLKENIEDLSSDEAILFIKELHPKRYNWKSDQNNLSIGYIAQDILRLRKWDCLVSLSEDSELKEEIDSDGLLSPSGKRFQVSYQNVIPILHQALKHALKQIEKLSEQVDELRELILNDTTSEPSPVAAPVVIRRRRIKRVVL